MCCTWRCCLVVESISHMIRGEGKIVLLSHKHFSGMIAMSFDFEIFSSYLGAINARG